MSLDVPDGMALTCQLCGYRPADNLTMGVLAAHFETEHDTADVRLDLVVICDRCDVVMPLQRTQGRKSYHDCPRCHRTRVITQSAMSDES